jgi:hypothetical protein
MIGGMATSSSTDPIVEQVDAIIRAHRFAVIPVGYGGACSQHGCCGPAAEQPWTYSIGLAHLGLPEFVVMGLNPGGAHRTVNALGDDALAGLERRLDEPFTVNGLQVKLVTIPDTWLLTDPSRMGTWFNLNAVHRRVIGLPRLIQVVWAHAEGRFPDDAAYKPDSASRQPILRDDPVSQPHRSQREARKLTRHQQQHHRRVA